MFQRRHYEKIALAMQAAFPRNDLFRASMTDRELLAAVKTWRHTVTVMAAHLAGTNPQFDLERFLSACQPNANVRVTNRRRRRA